MENKSICNKTPWKCCLKFRGYGFAWFPDSILGVYVANELLACNLCSDVQLYHSYAFGGDDCDDLPISWAHVVIGNNEFYLQRPNAIKVAEWRMIGSIISQIVSKYRKNEKSCY